MSTPLKGLISWLLATISWVADRLYGDALFEWIRPMIPEWISSPALDGILTWAPPSVLVALGLYFFWHGQKEGSTAPPPAPAPARTSPPTRSMPAKRDVGVSEAVSYVAFRSWGHEFFDAAASSAVDGNSELDQFVQSAADGDIPVWGQKRDGAVYEPIPATYWFDHRIEWFSLLKGAPFTEHATKGSREPIQTYQSLMTSRTAAERLWPRKDADEGASKKRTITSEQRQRLIQHIRQAPSLSAPIKILFDQGFDCAEYAHAVGDIINASGHWECSVSAVFIGPPSEVTGLRIWVRAVNKMPTDARLIADALSTSGIEFDWWQSEGVGEDYLTVMVARPRRAI